MKLSREAKRQARELFDLSMVEGRLAPSRLETIFSTLGGAKPRSYIQILKELTRLVRLQAASQHAVIESASALAPERAAEFESSLRSRFGGLTTEFRQNPALIGGLRVQIGSDVWDGSIQARLEALKQQL